MTTLGKNSFLKTEEEMTTEKLSRLLPNHLLHIGIRKTILTDMTVADIMQWHGERNDAGNEIADKIFSGLASAVTWEQAKDMVAEVSKHAVVIHPSELFVISYDDADEDEDGYAVTTVVNTRISDGAVVRRPFCDMDLDAEALREAGLVYLSAAQAMQDMSSEQQREYAPSADKLRADNRLMDARDHEISDAVGRGWL